MVRLQHVAVAMAISRATHDGPGLNALRVIWGPKGCIIGQPEKAPVPTLNGGNDIRGPARIRCTEWHGEVLGMAGGLQNYLESVRLPKVRVSANADLGGRAALRPLKGAATIPGGSLL